MELAASKLRLEEEEEIALILAQYATRGRQLGAILAPF